MARAILVKAARKPIYQRGLKVEYVSQKGKKAGQTLSKIDRTQPADENDQILINVGESYYTWSFMFGSTFYSKTEPKQSQLTNSSFLQQYYVVQERIQESSNFEYSEEGLDELRGFVEEIKDELSEMQDQCQESLDAMPEHLQEASSSGQTLQERVEELENLISELDNIDLDMSDAPDFEDVDFLNAVAEENDIDVAEDGWEEKITDEMKEELSTARYQEFIDEKLEELGSLSFNL